MRIFVKDPEATLDYGFDWGPWLQADTIATSNWSADAGITLVPASDTFTDTTTAVFISGGTAGQSYDVINTITTNGSRTDERTITIKVRNR
jgi:hypothetical protein